ncbi:hypothetical protein N0V87_000833 [Didymella glomerata]|uniref:Uncharacterized protein n=1 Tax=Didymella glomerata TaxID=749621 RepID=A0A9W8X812_9PLEO|nr:hypothetical protein N0V87_000833 [Didymella glomerata]
MGRGAYDLTEPAEKKSAMGGAVLKWEGDNQRARDGATAEVVAAELEAKLERSKKSRAFKNARREAILKNGPSDKH